MYERNIEDYIKLLSEIVKEDTNYTIDQYKLNNMPLNIILLRKMLKIESNLLKNIHEEEKNIQL